MAANTFLYCLWLRPGSKDSARLTSVIHGLAEAHGTPKFDPHITLAAATSERSGAEVETEASDWMARSSMSVKSSFRLDLGPATVGETRHQCILAEVLPTSTGFSSLLKMREGAIKSLSDCSILQQQPASVYYPHLSLVYGDFPRDERVSISRSGIACEGGIDVDCLELWVVPMGAPESEWYKLKEMKLDGIDQDLDKLKEYVQTIALDDKGEQEGGEDEEDEEEDWETSVDNFQLKSIDKVKEEVDWDAAEQEEESSHDQVHRTAGIYSEHSTTNLLEAYNFPRHLDEFAIEELMKSLRASGINTQPVDRGLYLLVFRSATKAGPRPAQLWPVD
ncbi:hypothetical protein GUITHDRAFT_107036 [Guillardia theta CCMP2712]|uniref:2',3'-cyclic-nucleotide 3'-phosphodiesterase n=1 Tax=Guillardia theta (strain CCMP2712) TaxID=905079 RepID=L1JF05_GUITC|nr:hypothetical protein GUITHDRAFT_107036 [Guillardia theta CCMP2712]EKX47123.1 hypothetical protein GUITHDRAFT_107036 [Guillardia theta CCMP2712]|eukprot:XP_005834103.1 hypothetical protein GUITHDRAFT_107036 [Guillardia theta CCMP2712]